MRRSCLALVLFVLLSVSSATGQYVGVIEACNRDVARFCSPSAPGGDRLTECIKTHFQDFAEPCKTALVRIAPVRESCGTDIRKQCRAVNPSAGRVLLCVKKHYTALSEARRTRKAAGGLGAMSYQMARCSAV